MAVSKWTKKSKLSLIFPILSPSPFFFLALFPSQPLSEAHSVSLSASLNQKSQETSHLPLPLSIPRSPSLSLQPTATFAACHISHSSARVWATAKKNKPCSPSVIPVSLSLSQAKSFRPPAKNGFWSNPSFQHTSTADRRPEAYHHQYKLFKKKIVQTLPSIYD